MKYFIVSKNRRELLKICFKKSEALKIQKLLKKDFELDAIIEPQLYGEP